MAGSLHSTEYTAFRAALQNAREHAGITQAALAKALAKPQSFVSKYESGERRLDVVEFISVCRALKVNPARLLERVIERLS